MAVKALALCLCLGGCVGWSKRDTAGELAFGAEMATDWAQSVSIGQHCDEMNPIVGHCGERLDYYIPASALVHLAVSAALPPGPWRHGWQWFTAGVEASTVVANWELGYRP